MAIERRGEWRVGSQCPQCLWVCRWTSYRKGSCPRCGADNQPMLHVNRWSRVCWRRLRHPVWYKFWTWFGGSIEVFSTGQCEKAKNIGGHFAQHK